MMNKKGKLFFESSEFNIEIFNDNHVAKELIKYLPVCSECNNIGGEIYFRVPGVNIKYESTQVKFEIGDIVYWRSPSGEKKFTIALFYGNTMFSNWMYPQAFSPCVKVGKIINNLDSMASIKSGEKIKFITDNYE